ncbi:MAG: Cof-type HAD-IIB family hydrolase [Vibrio sp.]
MYKLIAIDMDGTLLDPNGEITTENKHAIEQAQSQGVHVVLASGRPIDGMQAALNTLALNTDQNYVISYNGALVQNVATKKVIHQSLLTHEQVLALASRARELELDFHAFSSELGLITPKMNPWTQHECDINNISVEVMDLHKLDHSHLYLKAMIVGEEAALDAAIEVLDNEVGTELNMVRTASFFLEFMPLNISKWTGIEALLGHLDIQPGAVMALGDQGNDHEMIKNAGLGVAMKNATLATQKIADVITESNANSGVGRAIEKYVLN